MSLPVFICPKLRSQWDLQFLSQVKKKTKILQIIQIKKIITKSNWHQIKHEQNKISYTLLKRTWDQSSLRLDNKLTKRAKWYEVQKYVSIFENN